MSARLMGQAFYAQLPMLEKMVLLVLCDHANDAGEHVFAGTQVLAVKVGVSERTILRARKALEGLALVTPTTGGGRGIQRHVRINLPRLREEAQKGDKLARFPAEKGDKSAPETLTNGAAGGDVSSLIESTATKDSNSNQRLFTALSGTPDPLPRKSHIRDPKQQREAAIEILGFLNRRTGHRYQPVEANLRMIMARLREGATITAIRAVIGAKTDQWKDDPKMAEYLRPDTLFNATKFASYVGQLPEAAVEVEA